MLTGLSLRVPDRLTIESPADGATSAKRSKSGPQTIGEILLPACVGNLQLLRSKTYAVVKSASQSAPPVAALKLEPFNGLLHRMALRHCNAPGARPGSSAKWSVAALAFVRG